MRTIIKKPAVAIAVAAGLLLSTIGCSTSKKTYVEDYIDKPSKKLECDKVVTATQKFLEKRGLMLLEKYSHFKSVKTDVRNTKCLSEDMAKLTVRLDMIYTSKSGPNNTTQTWCSSTEVDGIATLAGNRVVLHEQQIRILRMEICDGP